MRNKIMSVCPGYVGTCAGCLGSLRDNDAIVVCTQTNCENKFHKEICIGSAIPGYEELTSWICPQCKCKTKRGGDNSSTPVRGSASTPDSNITQRRKNLPLSQTQAPVNLNSLDTSPNLVPSTTQRSEILALTSEIRLLRQEVSTFKAKLDNVSSAMATLNEQMVQLVATSAIRDERLTELEDRFALDTTLLKEQVHVLEDKLNTQAQAYLRNEVEIVGIPESSNENLLHLALVAAKKLGAELKEDDIDWVLRAGPKKTHTESNKSSMPIVSRPVVIRLIRRVKRNDFLKCVKTHKSITTKDLGVDNLARRVYFNERLTYVNRQLFRESRNRDNKAGYRFCWSFNGSIFLRKAEGHRKVHIRNSLDLDSLFSSSDCDIPK